ncbi:MAG: RNA polymerase subunit sigma-70 [Planctomycetaceae bacterium]|nr:RNA polymerase subunit sigma-70 [Planctomycetaceae bacterium]
MTLAVAHGTPRMTAANPADHDQLADERLIEQYQQGQHETFDVLVHRYRQELFHFLSRFLGDRAAADDVFQDTFLQVHISADTFDTSRRFRPWLFTIAANKARDHLRKKARRPAAPLSAPIGGDDSGQTYVDLLEADLPMPHDLAESGELADRMSRTIQTMPDHLREILLLAYFEKLSYAEIAEVLSVPLGTVKSRLHAAVGTFADRWKSQNPDGSVA